MVSYFQGTTGCMRYFRNLIDQRNQDATEKIISSGRYHHCVFDISREGRWA